MVDYDIPTPIYRRDDLFYRRAHALFIKTQACAIAVKRGNNNAVPWLWSCLWEFLPIMKPWKKIKKQTESFEQRLKNLANFIIVKRKKILFADKVREELHNLYMEMRYYLAPLELKYEAEELMTPKERRELAKERFLEDAFA